MFQYYLLRKQRGFQRKSYYLIDVMVRAAIALLRIRRVLQSESLKSIDVIQVALCNLKQKRLCISIEM